MLQMLCIDKSYAKIVRFLCISTQISRGKPRADYYFSSFSHSQRFSKKIDPLSQDETFVLTICACSVSQKDEIEEPGAYSVDV